MDSGNNHSGYNWSQQQSAIPQNQPHDPLSVLLSALAHVDPNYQQPQQPQPMQDVYNDPILAGEQSNFELGQQSSHFDSTMLTPFNYDHLGGDEGLSETPGHPRPLATKPLYKKRVIVPLAKPDSIIRRTGATAMERQWNGSRPGANFYDQSMASTLAVELPEQGSTPARKQTKVAKAAASISANKSRRRGGRPRTTPKEPKESRPPRQPKEPKPSKPKPPKAPTPPPIQYAPPALLAPPNRKISIEALGKKQELYRDKIMKMANRPMPPRELRVLVEAELEDEEKTLRQISSSLHKELLKLQLEEGVFLNMFRMAAAGGMELEISDFKKVKRRRRSDTSRAAMVGEHRESSTQPIAILSDTFTQGQENHEMAQVRAQEEGAQRQEGQERQIPTLVRADDEDEDDNQEAYEDEDDAFSEDWISKPTVQLPAQTYSMPGLPDMISNEGRPSSSAIPSIPNLRETDLELGVENPLDALKRMIVARGKQKTLQDSGNRENNMELDEDDLYTMEDDEDDDEEMLIELDDDGDEEEEEDLLRSLHRGGGSKVNEKPQPGPDQRNKVDSSGTESEDYGDEDDGEGGDEDEEDDEDEDRARDALQRMMSQYGVPGV